MGYNTFYNGYLTIIPPLKPSVEKLIIDALERFYSDGKRLDIKLVNGTLVQYSTCSRSYSDKVEEAIDYIYTEYIMPNGSELSGTISWADEEGDSGKIIRYTKEEEEKSV